MKFILGKKLGMAQIFDGKNAAVPVTVVEALPNIVLQAKTAGCDGYCAVQAGYGKKKAENVKKPQRGHFKNFGSFQFVREFRLGDAGPALAAGEVISVSAFQEGDVVRVSAVSKGKGFAGVVKRHHFKGGPASHGHPHNHRAPGSIGCRFPQHVHKGKRMAGHMGHEMVTVRNLKIVKVDAENNLLAITGAIPGARGTLVKIVSK